jgi:coenzyme F420-reducing hydrogenase delta subunit
MNMKTRILKISLFYCSNSLTAEEIQTASGKIENVDLKTFSLPCSGKVNLLYLLKAIETGSDGAVLMTCKMGECKFLQGNLRAQKRIDSVNELLEETGIGKERVLFISLEEKNSTASIITELNKFSKQLQATLEAAKETA